MSPTPEKPDPDDITHSPNATNEEIITKEFIQRALQKEANGAPVPEICSHSVTLGTKPGDNYMSIIYSVDVELSDGNGKKRHLLIKCYPNHPMRQEYTNKSNMFFKELEVYSKWIPELKRFQTENLGFENSKVLNLPYAHFVHGDCIDFQSEEGQGRMTEKFHSLDNFIMMEDLRKTYGFKMANRQEPLDLDHMRLVIQALAKVHSLSWAYRHHVESNILEKFSCFVLPLTEEDLEMFANLIYANLEQAKQIYDEEFGPGNEYSAAAESFKPRVVACANIFTMKERMEGWEKFFRISTPDQTKFGKDSDNPEPWRIICHGDCWNNNLLFRYDPDTGKPIQVVLVDLQIAQEACVTNDLQYLVYCCTDLDFRKSHLDELLQLYHDSFNSICEQTKTPTLPGFCMDSLRFRFHRAKFFGYYMSTMGLPLMLKAGGEISDMENMGEDTDIGEAMAQLSAGSGSNTVFKKRLIEVTKGMIEDGVF